MKSKMMSFLDWCLGVAEGAFVPLVLGFVIAFVIGFILEAVDKLAIAKTLTAVLAAIIVSVVLLFLAGIIVFGVIGTIYYIYLKIRGREV